MDPKTKILKELTPKFNELCKKSIDEQTEFFLKSFIFALEDKWKDVVSLQEKFKEYLKTAGEGAADLNVIQASDFLQKNGIGRTALQRNEELKDIDLDNNQRISWIEYLLLHYKAMILAEYYKRTGEQCTEDLSNGGIGITKVGHKLLDELFAMPYGLSAELTKALEDFTAKKKAREAKEEELKQKAAAGGVKGKAAENELKQMQTEDSTEMNKMQITLDNALKKAIAQGQKAINESIESKKQKEEEEKARKAAESRAKLKEKTAMWENKP